MGNYQEYVKRLPPPMREIETQPARQHTFGNPFKVNKNLMIDEADEAMPGQQSSRKRAAAESPSSPRPNKRKPGPLPKGVAVRTLLSPVREVSTPPPSPHYDTFNDIALPENDDEIYIDDDHLAIATDNSSVDLSETTPQLNHVYSKANGDLDNDIDAVLDTKQLVTASSAALRRQSSTGSTAAGPVNGLKTHEHNIILQKMAIVQVKKPGKDFAALFRLLDGLDGTTDECCTCISTVIHEAERFKRHSLAQKLRGFLQQKMSQPTRRQSVVSGTSSSSTSTLSRTLYSTATVTVNCNHQHDAV